MLVDVDCICGTRKLITVNIDGLLMSFGSKVYKGCGLDWVKDRGISAHSIQERPNKPLS